MVVLLMSLWWRDAPQAIILGDAQHTVIASYVLAESPPPTPSLVRATQRTIERRVAPPTPPPKEAIALAQQPARKLPRPSMKKPPQASAATSGKRRVVAQHSRGEPTDALLALLHAAIAREQEYPASALALERTGRVTVAFILQTNGQVRDLHIAQSSGTTSLDRAALMAVTRAAPFAAAETYLVQEQRFHIDVVFNLA